jgi:hypothetical protein
MTKRPNPFIDDEADGPSDFESHTLDNEEDSASIQEFIDDDTGSTTESIHTGLATPPKRKKRNQ